MKDPETIPEIRARLLEMADELENHVFEGFQVSGELRDLAEATRRKPSIFKKVPARHPPMTLAKAKKIYFFKLKHPKVGNHEMAVRFGCNQGRITDAYRMAQEAGL